MKNRKSFALVIFAGLIFACLQTATLGQTSNEGKLASVTSNGSSVKWAVTVANNGMNLTISAPDGRSFTREYRAGTSPEITLTDRQFDRLPDGAYGYELRLRPILTSAAREALMSGRGKDDEPESERAGRRRPVLPALVQSGSFAILNGRVIVAGAVEGQRRTAKTMEPRPSQEGISGNTVARLSNHRASLSSMPDQVIPDDLIVQGSACVGLDCVNNENFGVDTIKLKENNTRIKFDDTSTLAGFPSNDWQLTANDSASGGSSKFSIEDITGAKVPFTITAGAATNSIFVDNSGHLGLRTAIPLLDVHANTSNTPGIRLEQNSSSGFTAQTWDMAGNEANFFVRDVTGGSRLPFRIRPGAPTSSIDISASGNVGIGTASPSSTLHIQSSSDPVFTIKDGANAGFAQKGRILFLDNASTERLNVGLTGDGSGDAQFKLSNDKAIRFFSNATERLTIATGGNVGIGTTAPDLKLSVSGDADKSVGGGSWQFFSDERLKNIKGRFNSGLKAVMQLEPIRFQYKRDNALGLQSELEQVGFGAQALQKIIPEAVTKNANGYLMVNNDPILWTMLNAIKEQQQAIKEQQKEIAELKGQVRRLQATSRRHGK
jgi:hypothetical protein